MKTIKDYLPTKEANRLVQARIPLTVVQPVKEYMQKNGIGWSDLITALFKKLLDETGSKKVRQNNGS